MENRRIPAASLHGRYITGLAGSLVPLFLLAWPLGASVSADTTASAPGNLTAEIVAGVISLSWDAPTEDRGSVSGYQVLRTHAGAQLTILKDNTGSTSTTYTDASAARPSMAYNYQVKAWRNEELSDASNEVSATIPHSCAGEGFNAAPENVPVTAVPIVVASTTADYFVLFVRPDLSSDAEIPISVTLGQDGMTTLTEQLAALPKAHYRVEKYPVANPADVDGDCTHDIDELADVGTKNPVNRSVPIPFKDGTVAIPDRATFERLSYQGTNVPYDAHLANLEFVNFSLYHMDSDRPGVYFANTETHQLHTRFASTVNLPRVAWMKGEIVYYPHVVAPDGSLGVYRFGFGLWDGYSFEEVQYAYAVLAASMPLLENNLAYYPMPNRALPLYRGEKAKYDNSRINVVLDQDIFPDVTFTALNQGTGYGFLRVMSPDERPNPRDIVIYESPPNDLPRVAGIITTVPQTPLSHVNLRALQDRIPNAFVRDALADETLDSLLDSHVHYTVTEDGYTMRAATKAEVDAHHESSRPPATQTPARDLTVTEITPLSDIGFDDWDAFGVKAANVAVLGTLDFPEGTVPDGFAVPFYFYNEFMKSAALAEETVFGKGKGADEDKLTLAAGTKLSAVVTAILAHSKFQTDYEIQDEMLDDLRDAIKDATTPAWIISALEEMHATYPEGQSLRYRSSTNNEDLPGLSGAGLYDSKTQDPDETAEDGIDKSIKGVWASLWNFRAFVERDFHRIDHNATAMGVLVHPNYSDELANGVAVSYDPISNQAGAYYVNTQIGEDLVTNPEARSVPEELLLVAGHIYEVLVYSNQTESAQLIMSAAQVKQLHSHLRAIHNGFEKLYKPAEDERFAMEIEFKITSDNVLAIKQARPWVFRPINEAPEFPSTETGVREVTEGTPPDTEFGAPVAATDAEGDSLTYFLNGPDSDWFHMDTSSGQLRTNKSLDYETKDRYEVYVTASDPFNPAVTILVTILVTEVPSTVSLSPTLPRVGTELTATLRDPDAIGSVSTWRWEWSEEGSVWNRIAWATTESYTPSAADVGRLLRATATYADGNGAPREAVGVTERKVTNRPLPPPPRRGGGGRGGGPTCPQDDMHGNSATRATDIGLSSPTDGTLCPATDVDYFTVTVPGQGLVFVDTTGSLNLWGTLWARR